jgi:hypothetical protein
MKYACNDELSFVTLSAATKNVLRWLDTQQKQGAVVERDEKNADSEHDKCSEAQRSKLKRNVLDVRNWR